MLYFPFEMQILQVLVSLRALVQRKVPGHFHPITLHPIRHHRYGFPFMESGIGESCDTGIMSD